MEIIIALIVIGLIAIEVNRGAADRRSTRLRLEKLRPPPPPAKPVRYWGTGAPKG